MAPARHPTTEVIFEADHVDMVAGTGSSVVIQSRADGVVNPTSLPPRGRNGTSCPELPTTRSVVGSITPTATTGRVVRAPFAA